MHGIQHLFRQHALEKQTSSTDSLPSQAEAGAAAAGVSPVEGGTGPLEYNQGSCATWPKLILMCATNVTECDYWRNALICGHRRWNTSSRDVPTEPKAKPIIGNGESVRQRRRRRWRSWRNLFGMTNDSHHSIYQISICLHFHTYRVSPSPRHHDVSTWNECLIVIV